MTPKHQVFFFDQSFADAVPDAFIVVDHEGLIRYHNCEVNRMFAVPDGRSLIGEPIETLVPHEAHERHVVAREAYDQNPHRRAMSPDFTIRARRLDGNVFPCEVSLSPVQFSDDRFTVCVVRDVTDRLRARDLLELEQHRLASLVELSTLGVAELRPDGSFLTANAQLRNILEREPTAIRVSDWYDLIDERYRAELVRTVKRSVSHRQGFAAEFRANIGERLKWLRVHAAPLVRSTDELFGWLAIFEDVTERKLAEERLVQRALHDPLTGLPNHAHLVQLLTGLLGAAGGDNEQVAVLFVDLDRFKSVNEEIGHDRGDILLQQVARRIQDCVRPSEIVARVAGDEFVIVCPDVSNEADARRLAERVLECFDEPFDVDRLEIRASATVGFALRGNGSAEAAIRDADTATRATKRLGGGVGMFSAAIAASRTRRRDLEQMLHESLEHKQVSLAYQPIVDVVNGRMIGVEALARFAPTNAEIGTEELIAVAEDTGLIVPIGRSVVAQALAEFAAAGIDEGVELHINVSPRQLDDPMLTEILTSHARTLGLAAHRITLEITEVAAVPESSRGVLIRLAGLGFHLVVDDFGMGHASLLALERLPVERLKIDRSFVAALVQKPRGEEVVATIIRIAHTLGLDVVAEGVESAEQRDTLLRLGCHLMQGFFFARPMSIEQLKTSLDAMVESAGAAMALPVSIGHGSGESGRA